MASTDRAAYVLGGATPIISDVIAQFKKDEWSYYSLLFKRRVFHGSITLGNQTMVVGGDSGDDS